MPKQTPQRVIIELVKPQVDGGQFPIKRIVGEKVVVHALIFADGHDCISANLLYRKENNSDWEVTSMLFLGNDEWEATFVIDDLQTYYYTVEAWVDRFQTWQQDLKKRSESGQNVKNEILEGVSIIEEKIKKTKSSYKNKLREWASSLKKETNPEQVLSLALSEELSALLRVHPDKNEVVSYDRELKVIVERARALFSAWYEMFPRSCSAQEGKRGTLKDCQLLVPEIAQLGFDILYLTPIHPIGKTNRKGKNNSSECNKDDVGSPWAIGSNEGGHKSTHPELGNMHDFESLVKKTKEQGMEIALDLAFQCSPDHPHVKEHPEWFKWRSDGTVQFAENPPKKYEDIIPFDFNTKDWEALWQELKTIVIFWIKKGVRVFRVDNPHTKPFEFWEWLIKEVKKECPEVIFLSESFTRPKVMYRLAKIGFTQSYTYFTWRNTKRELTDYIEELTKTDVVEYFRPNFWPNTPDILSEYLQYGGKPAFISRLVLAATLSSNYGIYGPAYELCVNSALSEKEEYLDAEKYEIKKWDRNKPGNLKELIKLINKIRKENPALQATRDIKFYRIDNEHLIAYAKTSVEASNIIITIVNIDPFHTQSGWIHVPINELGISSQHPYLAHDLLSNDKYIWQGEWNYIELNPQVMPAHILQIHSRLRREQDFDYYL